MYNQSKDIRCSASENSSATLLLSEINETLLPTSHQQNNSAHHSHLNQGHKAHAHAQSHQRGSSISNPPPSNSKHLHSNGMNTNPFTILNNSVGNNKNGTQIQSTNGKDGSSSNGSGGILKPVYNGTSSSTLSSMSNSSPPPITIKKEQIV